MIELDLTDLIKWEGEIANFPQHATPAAEGAMGATVLFLHGKLPPYPGPAPRGTAAKHWTAKQRRFFFAALRKGQIKVPDARTGTLGRSFTTQVTAADGEVRGELGTNLSYAPWVVGPSHPGETIRGRQMYQARIHENRWWQLGAVFDANKDEAGRIFADEFYNRFIGAVVAEQTV